MNVNLSQEECQNVKVALLSLAKQPSTNEQGMAMLLMLARKFEWVEEKSEEKEEKK